MSIGSVGGCSPSQMQATQYSSNAATGASRAPPPAQGGGEFVSAIAGALGELDVGSAASADTGAAGGTGAAQALGDFLGSLMEALKSQGGQQGQQGGLQADLRSLIGGLDNEDSDSGALATSFASLLSSLGLDSSAAGDKLGAFLDSLAARLDASGPSGNLINTTA